MLHYNKALRGTDEKEQVRCKTIKSVGRTLFQRNFDCLVGAVVVCMTAVQEVSGSTRVSNPK